jgi:hypothetical protein
MPTRLRLYLCAFTFFAAFSSSAQKLVPKQPPIPVGLDAYRHWDQWPTQRIGMRATMRSTFDRAGGNEAVDASHFLYQLSDTFNAALDIEGSGILMFERFNHWHGSPWQYVIDGKTHILAESSTADPNHPLEQTTFIPAAPFPPPLNETFHDTLGANLVRTPIGFEKSLTLAYSRTMYGTGYYIYDQFVPGTPLSHPITSWSEKDIPSKDVLDLLKSAGSDIAPTQGTHAQHGTLTLPTTGSILVADLKGKSTLRALAFSIPQAQATAFEHTRLRITWDDRTQPSVDVPIALFYGAGTLYNREHREFLVKALPVNIRFHDNRIDFACYFPMPFFKSARIELVAPPEATPTTSIPDIHWSLRTLPLTDSPSHQAYFHATYRDFPSPTRGEDMVLLDTRGIEGAHDWSGSFIGTSFIFSHAAELHTLEGDPRFFFDDSLTPQAQGTGTEEWGGGGDYWMGGRQSTLALVGHPVGVTERTTPNNDADKIESAYRFLLGDLFPFGKNAVIRFEHGGVNEFLEHYETIAYWYGLPAPSLVQTDQLQLGDLTDEAAHAYKSPDASAPYDIASRYEWGVDHIDGKPTGAEVYPESHDKGRTIKTTSEFDLTVRPDNLGVLLRRKLDYQYPNQRAEVSIQSAAGNWQPAGIWYLAGSNTVVYSSPTEELGAAQHIAETSNRRFRDDDFLIPRNLTEGRSKIRVRIHFTPVNRPLFPGRPQDEQAWSEIRYTAYSFITPAFKP